MKKIDIILNKIYLHIYKQVYIIFFSVYIIIDNWNKYFYFIKFNSHFVILI